MRKLGMLWKLNFRAMLGVLSLGGGKKTAGGLGVLALMAFLALYCSSTYSFLLTDALSAAGLTEFVLPLMSIMAYLMSLMLTVMAASGLVFGGKDTDLMLTLPVPAFTVVLGKVLALYLENFVFCGMWMLPTSLAYLMDAGLGAGGGALFCVRMALALPFLPLVPSFIGLLCGWAISFASGHMRHSSLAATALSLLFVGLVLVGSFQLQGFVGLLITQSEQVRHVLHTWLLPFGLLLDGLMGSMAALTGFAALVLLPFLALTWLVGTRYRRILSAVASRHTRSDYKLREVKTGSAFSALFAKECRRYFGSTVYLLNTGIGAVMMIGVSVYALFARDKAALIVDSLGGGAAAAPMAALTFCLLESFTNTAGVSISLEGKTLWILKEAPVPALVLFGAKALLGALVAGVPGMACAVLLSLAAGIPWVPALALFSLALGLGVFVPALGLAVNLRFPKTDYENEAIVVKQSASSMISSFGGMAVVGAGALAWSLLSRWLSFAAFGFLAAAVLVAAATGLWNWVCRRGPEILRTL